MSAMFGCARFIYNWCLAYRQNAYDSEGRSVTQNECMLLITQMRHETSWLADADSMALQEAAKDVNKAFVNFFEKRAGYPRFKSKRNNYRSYRTRNQNNCVRIEGKYIVLPKLGKVKARISRLPNGRILNATVSCTPSGKYFVSLCVEEELVLKPNAGGVIGLDLGIKDLYVDSNGYKEPNPKTLARYEKKLRREMRSLSRMLRANIKGYDSKRRPVWIRPIAECKNIQKQRIKIAKLYERIYNIRTDNLHKVTTKLVNENQVICVESLNVKGMVRNHKLAKAISDASWSRFVAMLEYKALEHDCEIKKVETFFPSSQTCSSCGYKNPRVKDLQVRKWKCPVCGTKHDRDVNAAINILNKAQGV